MTYIALIMTVVKLLLDLTIYILKSYNQHKSNSVNTHGLSCKYCQIQDGHTICVNLLFKRNMQGEICPRQRCWGFNTGNSSIDNDTPLISAPGFLLTKKIVDIFPELAVALLALNEIL